MTSSDKGNRNYRLGEGSPVDNLALSVISKISDGSNKHRNRRLDVGTRMLLTAVLEDPKFDQDQMIADLQSFRINQSDMIDHCIPQAAAQLGEFWSDNTLSFTRVSSASARLFGLCKAIGREWDGIRPQINSRTILLATVKREDHIIGPALLAEQLRRRGHSVRMLTNSNGSEIAQALREAQFDGVLISASSLITLEFAKEAIRKLADQRVEVPVVLGGACLGLAESEFKKTGADLVTNDIDKALDAMSGNDVALRVAE